MIRAIIIYFGTALILSTAIGLLLQLLHEPLTVSIALSYAYLAIAGLIFESLLIKTQDAKKFVTAYMALSGGKMFLSIFILFIYLFLHRDEVWVFGLSFLGGYFVFTALEITRLLRYFKK